jgi:sulfur-oxidizing protein SoxX
MRRSMLHIHGGLKPGSLLFATLVVLVLAQVNGLRAEQTMDQRLAAGKNLAMARDKGNCLACHAIADGELPGDIGPPLLYMQQRFPDKKDLRAQIWDPTVRNPDTVMPPFGKHRILTGEEIDLIVDYIQTL